MIKKLNDIYRNDKKINVKVFSSSGMGANCYLVSSENKTIIIDPCVPYHQVCNYICGSVVGIFITHGHFDHFDCVESYLDNLIDLKVYASKKCFQKMENAKLNCSSYFLNDVEIYVENKVIISEGKIDNLLGDEININALYTPGHTDCSYTFIINDLMFTGDFLFKNSIGRTDLYSGNNDIIAKSLKKMYDFANDYIVYPGHSGFTTLHDEIENNYYLKRLR